MPSESQTAPSAASAAPSGVDIERARRRAESVGQCLKNVAQTDSSWGDRCLVRYLPLDVVDHVPRIAPRNTRFDAAEVLSYSLGLSFDSTRYDAALLLQNGEHVVVLGTFHATPGPIALPAAAMLNVNDKERISAARVWFDQRALQAQLDGVAKTSASKDAKGPRIVVARSDDAEKRQLNTVQRALSASRSGDVAALSGLYAERAVLHDHGPGVDVSGAATIAQRLGVRQTVAAEQSWAAGDYVVAELRRRIGELPESASLEIFRFEASRISEHWLFHNDYRRDLVAGTATPPAARAGSAALRAANAPALLEGLPHPMHEKKLLAAELKAKTAIELHGYPFYREPLPLKRADATWITELLVDARSLREFSGEKKCGGFHPDYAVQWQSDGKRYDALLCFGCGEVKWATGGKVTRYDMAPWAMLNLETALHGYRKQRPLR